MKKMLIRANLLLAVMAVFALAGTALADQRTYVWTYEYLTLSRDSAEFEIYLDAKTADRQQDNSSDWRQQFELEYGITDRFDAGFYLVYEQKEEESLKYTGYKIRFRYRIAEKNVLPLDLLLYAEHQEKVDADNVFEGKLILAKDIGNLNIAYNQIYKNTYTSGDGADHQYAAGASYPVASNLRLGVESKGDYGEDTYALGPTLSWVGGRIWANIGAVYGLNRRTNDREVRFILGIPF